MCFFLLLKEYMMGYDGMYDGYPQVTLVIQRRGLDHHHFIAGKSSCLSSISVGHGFHGYVT